MSPSTLDVVYNVAGWLALCLYYGMLCLEVRRHRMNKSALNFIGLRQKNPYLYGTYYSFICALPIAAGILSLFEPRGPFAQWEFIVAGPILCASQILRSSAISALGNGWAMGFFWNEQWTAVRSGPYRFINHPEYISRILDGLGFSLIFGVSQAMSPVLIVFVLFSIALGRAEETRMSQMSHPRPFTILPKGDN